MNQWYSLSQTFTVTHKEDHCGKESSKKYCSKKIGNSHQFGHNHSLSQFVDDMKDGWKETGVLRKEIDLESDAFAEQVREAEVDHHAVQATADLFRIITTTDVTDKKQKILSSDHSVELRCGGTCRNMC